MGAIQQRNIERIRAFYAAFAAGGIDAESDFFDPDFVWHVPGDNPVSGPYGKRDYFSLMPERMGPLDGWRVDVLDVMANDDIVVATVHLVGDRKGIHVDMDGAHAFRLTPEGAIAEAWGFLSDQAALDAFFSA